MTKYCFKIRRPDQTGDSCVATFDPTVESSIAPAQKTIEDFWSECVDEHNTGNVFGLRVGESEYGMMARGADIREYTDILLQNPLSGG